MHYVSQTLGHFYLHFSVVNIFGEFFQPTTTHMPNVEHYRTSENVNVDEQYLGKQLKIKLVHKEMKQRQSKRYAHLID